MSRELAVDGVIQEFLVLRPLDVFLRRRENVGVRLSFLDLGHGGRGIGDDRRGITDVEEIIAPRDARRRIEPGVIAFAVRFQFDGSIDASNNQRFQVEREKNGQREQDEREENFDDDSLRCSLLLRRSGVTLLHRASTNNEFLFRSCARPQDARRLFA